MKPQLAVVMDPIESILPHKDSTFAMLLEAQHRQWNINYLRPGSLNVADAKPFADSATLSLRDQTDDWYTHGRFTPRNLAEFDVILMRKDPPFNMEYIYATYILELAQQAGALVVNPPAALRNFNEKFSITRFPHCCAPTLISREREKINSFAEQHGEIVVKPLDAMGGESVFRITLNDTNRASIIEQISQKGQRTVMAQKFIAEICHGDKRILLVNAEPVACALARIPSEGEFRGNLATGGIGQGVPLSEQDRQICMQIKPLLAENGILFAGIDVIGEYLTEINITSPTCIRELDLQCGLNICAILFDHIETLLD